MASADRDRIASLDIIRGIAVMGILAMNILAFALPDSASFSPDGPHGVSVADSIGWLFAYLFFEGKMRTLFAMLFGASCLLVIRRAEQSAQSNPAAPSPARVHYARMLWLLLFGIAHYILFWWGDILAFYALYGLMLYFMRNLAGRKLWIVALFLVVLDTLMFASGGVQLLLDHYRVSGFLIPAADRAGFESAFSHDAKLWAKDMAVYRGDYMGMVAHRLTHSDQQIGAIISFLPGLTGTMLVGMALFRSGFLTGEWDSARYRTWALRCLLIGLSLHMVLAAWIMAEGYAPAVIFMATLGVTMPLHLLVATGYAALVILAVRGAGATARWPDWLADTGRMAFSNYLGTTIVMTALFHGYGLGLYGHVSRPLLWLFVLGGWALMLLGSRWWLARYRYGPLEWLWRSLARWSFQPMRLQ